MNGTSIIVGGGIQAGSPFTLGRVPYITNVSPAQASSSIIKVAADSVSAVVYIGIPNSAGTYVADTPLTGATETFRVKGGAIIEGSGTDSVQLGRAAGATATDSIAIGRGTLADHADAVVIGRGAQNQVNGGIVIGALASNHGNPGVVIGQSAGMNGTGGVAIGDAASLSSSAGGSVGTAVGNGAVCVFQASANALAVGTTARASTGDTVIGDLASSNQDNVFGSYSVVVGNGAAANISGGNVFATVLGTSGLAQQKQAVVVGAGAQALTAGQTRTIVIGFQAKSSTTDAIVIGGGSVLTSKSIAIGAGAAEVGAAFLQLGAAGTPITTVLIGAGDTIVGPANKSIRFTNASGTDNQAGDLTFVAPRSTGAATPAKIIFQVGAVGASSGVLQTATAVLTIDDQKVTVAGTFVTPATFDASALPTAAGATGTLWVDTGAANVVKRV